MRLAVRMGIHTGLVVVGEVGGGGRARSNWRWARHRTWRRGSRGWRRLIRWSSAPTTQLVQGYFPARPLGTHALKGVPQPLRGVSGAAARAAPEPPRSRPRHGLTPLVGREEEVGLLRRRWAQARRAGTGGAAQWRGRHWQIAPGAGGERARGRLGPRTRWEWRCSPYYHHTALYPLIELLQRALHWHPGMKRRTTKLEILVQALRQYRAARGGSPCRSWPGCCRCRSRQIATRLSRSPPNASDNRPSTCSWPWCWSWPPSVPCC